MEDKEEEHAQEHEHDMHEEEDNITFEILVGGSMRGRCKLKDSKGYCYTVKAQKGKKTWWRCSKRTKTLKCPASVIQIADTFILGRYPHEHPAIMKRMSRVGVGTPNKKDVEYRQPSWMNGSSDQMENDSDMDEGSSFFTCDTLDENSEDQNQNSSGSSLKLKISSAAKNKKQDNETESNLQEELLKIEKERLSIDKQRLAIEKQRLEIEKQRLEEIKKHNSQCTCMNRDESQPYSVLLSKNF